MSKRISLVSSDCTRPTIVFGNSASISNVLSGFALFLSQSVEDTLVTVPDDISGQYRMKATYDRMASEVNVPLERLKRDVTLKPSIHVSP